MQAVWLIDSIWLYYCEWGVYVLVDRTGTHTEAGAAQADIAADNACGKAVSEFGKVVRATLRSVPPPR